MPQGSLAQLAPCLGDHRSTASREDDSHLQTPTPPHPRTFTPCCNVAAMPTSTSSSSVTPCSVDWCPTVTRLPITVSASCSPKYVPDVRTTQLSWMLVCSPTVMLPASAAAGARPGRRQ